MSYLLAKQKEMDKLRIQESEILESVHNLKTKILKSELGSVSKENLAIALIDIESAIKDYFYAEYYNAKKIGNS